MKSITENQKDIKVQKGLQENIQKKSKKKSTMEESMIKKVNTKKIGNIGEVIAEIDIIETIGIEDIDINLDQKKEMMIIKNIIIDQNSKVKEAKVIKSKRYLKKN